MGYILRRIAPSITALLAVIDSDEMIQENLSIGSRIFSYLTGFAKKLSESVRIHNSHLIGGEPDTALVKKLDDELFGPIPVVTFNLREQT